jgi:hypothetical protein
MCLLGLPVQDGSGALDLLSLVALDEADLLRTLDAQVRADVTAAARMLARALHTCALPASRFPSWLVWGKVHSICMAACEAATATHTAPVLWLPAYSAERRLLQVAGGHGLCMQNTSLHFSKV